MVCAAVYGFVAVPLSDARLVVGFPEAEVLNRIDREIQLAYLQLAFFAILVLIIAWIGGGAPGLSIRSAPWRAPATRPRDAAT